MNAKRFKHNNFDAGHTYNRSADTTRTDKISANDSSSATKKKTLGPFKDPAPKSVFPKMNPTMMNNSANNSAVWWMSQLLQVFSLCSNYICYRTIRRTSTSCISSNQLQGCVKVCGKLEVKVRLALRFDASVNDFEAVSVLTQRWLTSKLKLVNNHKTTKSLKLTCFQLQLDFILTQSTEVCVNIHSGVLPLLPFVYIILSSILQSSSSFMFLTPDLPQSLSLHLSSSLLFLSSYLGCSELGTPQNPKTPKPLWEIRR